jgi:hypothetical protein
VPVSIQYEFEISDLETATVGGGKHGLFPGSGYSDLGTTTRKPPTTTATIVKLDW